MSSSLPTGLGLTSANLTYDDEFNSFTSSPDGSVGYRTTYPFGGENARTLASNHELEYYSDSSVGENPFSDANGVLSITASAAAPGSNPYNLPYDSGLATTEGMFQQQYGYFEVSAWVPAAQGTWAGFWLLPSSGLGGAELDAFEILGTEPNLLYTTTHSVNSNGVHTADSVQNVEPSSLATGFHTYGVDWEPNLITWYLDGNVVSTQTPPPGFDTPMYLLLNLALGGFGGAANAAQYPASMQIDYLRAYATANTIDVAGSAAIATASIAGLVKAGDAAASGVTVDLVDAAGNLLSSAVTDVNGYFIFTDLAAATYRVLYQPPAGSVPAAGSLADPITGMTAAVTLTDGQSLVLDPETLVAGTAASVTGTVAETAGNGAAATPVSGETVKLLNGNVVVDSTISQSDGTFLFTNLAAGTYTIEYTVRAGQSLAAGGPASVTTGLSTPVAVAAGQTVSLPVQTVMPTPGSVAGTVLYSATGMEGVAGVALPGATVTLMTMAGATVASLETDSNGDYLFTDVQAGEYRVMFASASGYAFLAGSAADPVTGISTAAVFVTAANRAVAAPETVTAASSVATLDGSVLYSDGTDPATPLAGVTVVATDYYGVSIESATTDATGTYSLVNLGPGPYQLNFSAPTGDTFQIGGPADFVSGTTASISLSAQQIYPVAPETLIADTPAAITGTVLQAPLYTTATGTGLAVTGETVSLIASSGVVAQTTTTDANGAFTFANLIGGDYTIQYSLPANDSFQAGGPASVTTGKTATIADEAGQTFTLAAETLVPLPATITGAASFDGAPENYVGVAVINAAGTVVASGTTNYTGNFTFSGLTAGAYQILYTAPKAQILQAGPGNPTTGLTAQFTLTAGSTTTLAPETLAPAPAGVTGAATLTSGLGQNGLIVEAISTSSGSVVASTVTSGASYLLNGLAAGSYQLQFVLPAGEYILAGPADPTTGLTGSFTLGAGQTLQMTHVTLAASSPGALGGEVVSLVDGAAVGQSGVAVTLISSGGTLTAATASNGSFLFKNLLAGSYQLSYAAPAGEVLQAGGPADPTTGLSGALTVGAGQTLTVANEMLAAVASAAITGTTLFGGAALAGVSVALLNAVGGAIATTTTNAAGAFGFAGLAAGSYLVKYTAPAGETLLSGPASNSTGLTATLTLAAGQSLPLGAETLGRALGTIRGTALYAGAGDGGVTVALLNAGGTVTMTTTSASGAYSFANIAAGSYQVKFTAPAGEVLQSGPASSSTGLTGMLALGAGQTLTVGPETLAASVTNSAIIGDVVFGGAGQAGVSVALLSGDGATTLATTTTNAAGVYTFSGLAAGYYRVGFVPPAGEVIVSGGPANATTGATAAFSVAAGATRTVGAVDLASSTGATITGSALVAGVGVAGVTVALLNAGGGAIATTTTTKTTGDFSFSGLSAGTYQLQYTAPSGEVLQSGPASSSTGLTGALTLAAGQTLALAPETLAAAPGTITGSALFAGAGQSGMSVTLLSAGGSTIVATTTTAANGDFSFAGLAAGSYQLQYAAPSGEALQTGPASSSTGLTGAVTLAAGQTLTLSAETLAALPQGLDGAVVHVGSGDPGTGLGGVMVALLNMSGTSLHTTLTGGSGAFGFKSLATGTYELQYTLPAGEAFQSGGAVNPTTGITGPIAYTANSALAEPTLDIVSSSNSFTINGPSSAAVRGDGSYVVTGNASSGNLLLGDGNQSVTLTGFSDVVTTGNGNQTISLTGTSNTVTVGNGTQSINAGNGFERVTIGATPAGTTSVIQAVGPGDKITATGAGNVSVSGPAGSATVTLGDGNQSVTLSGSGNTVTVGAGVSTIVAGQNGNVVHAGAGGDTISIVGQSDLLDAGAGMNFYNAAGTSRIDTFMLNGSGQGLTTISGFNATDTLDLARTVSGLGVLSDLSNLSSFVTASVANGATTLFVNTGGSTGTPYAFATLSGVSTSVASLLAGHNISLT